MKFDANVASFLLASVCASSGWFVWWLNKINTDKQLSTQRAAEAAKKEYAAQRDFEHLKNNLKQMSDGIAHEFKDLNERLDDIDKELLRLEAYLIRSKPTDHDPD